MLNEKQKKKLRALGHALHPLVRVGSSGLTENVLAAANEALEHHELIKVKVAAADRSERDQLIQTIAEKCNAELVQKIGHIALIYRRRPENSTIRI